MTFVSVNESGLLHMILSGSGRTQLLGSIRPKSVIQNFVTRQSLDMISFIKCQWNHLMSGCLSQYYMPLFHKLQSRGHIRWIVMTSKKHLRGIFCRREEIINLVGFSSAMCALTVDAVSDQNERI